MHAEPPSTSFSEVGPIGGGPVMWSVVLTSEHKRSCNQSARNTARDIHSRGHFSNMPKDDSELWNKPTKHCHSNNKQPRVIHCHAPTRRTTSQCNGAASECTKRRNSIVAAPLIGSVLKIEMHRPTRQCCPQFFCVISVETRYEILIPNV